VKLNEAELNLNHRRLDRTERKISCAHYVSCHDAATGWDVQVREHGERSIGKGARGGDASSGNGVLMNNSMGTEN
jgi:hypothetical protein